MAQLRPYQEEARKVMDTPGVVLSFEPGYGKARRTVALPDLTPRDIPEDIKVHVSGLDLLSEGEKSLFAQKLTRERQLLGALATIDEAHDTNRRLNRQVGKERRRFNRGPAWNHARYAYFFLHLYEKARKELDELKASLTKDGK